MSKEAVIDLAKKMAKDKFDATQNSKHQYVVAYKKVADDSLIGYHADSFCTHKQEKNNAKRYSSSTPEYSEEVKRQLSTIEGNVKHILGLKEGDKGMFINIHLNTQISFYKGLSSDDIYVEAIFLEEGIPKQVIQFTEV